ncbi:Ovca2, partial [Symbiodinium sp. CCMP2456]
MALRLLALHGFGQNAEVFIQKRAKELVRKLKGTAVLHAIDAPHPLPYDATLRGWWLYGPELWDGKAETIQALADTLLQRPSFPPQGLQESLSLVLAEWEKGYDGILGFSQGAILGAALCAELQRQGLPPPRCAVLISGFGKPVPEGVIFPSQPLPIPSLHIWGAEDDHIPAWASEALASRFEAAKTHAHGGQHFVPQKAADLNVVVDFLKSSLDPAAGAVPKPETAAAATKAALPVPSRAPMPGLEELKNALSAYRPAASCGQVRPPAAQPAATAAAAESTSYLPEELAPPGTGTYE